MVQKTESKALDVSALRKKCCPSIIAISMTYPRKFGFEGKAMVGFATGFVVDKNLGLVLTNRHVVMDGIVRAKGKFLHREKKEEVKLIPLYRDPIHDYGFFRFNPKALKGVQDIKLCPEGALVGEPIIIFGNQQKKQLSFEKGTITDVKAQPGFGMDYNTFMIAANDKTVPGFSGAPVLNSKGEAVAMVASSLRKDKMSYHFPLNRCIYAINFLKQNKPVIPRGTIQTTFQFIDKPQNLGIKSETITKMKIGSQGLLVADKVLNSGPGFKCGILHGDVLLSINNIKISDFLTLEDSVDSHVGKNISINVLRKKEVVKLKVVVQNFYEISPSELIEISNAVLHLVEYSVALHYNLSVNDGVFLASQGYMFKVAGIPAGSVIRSIGEYDTPDLDSMQAALESYPDGAQVSVRYFIINDRNKESRKMMVMDKKWFPFKRAKRNDIEGTWEYRSCSEKTNFRKHEMHLNKVGSKPFSIVDMVYSRRAQNKINPHKALVHVTFSMPLWIDGMSSDDEKLLAACVGVVVDVKLGLVVCERFQVPTTLGDALITFDGSLSVTANVVFVHPFHLFAILQYDTSLISSDLVSELKLNSSPVNVGDHIHYYGLSMKHSRSVHLDVMVGSSENVYMRPSPDAKDKFVPRNFEYFVGTQSYSGLGGVFLDPVDLSVRGFNFHFFRLDITSGIQASVVLPYVNQMRDSLLYNAGHVSHIKTLGIHLDFVPLVEARNTRGLSPEWATKLLESMDDFHRTVMVISQKLPDVKKLSEHDVILAINGKPVTRLSDFHSMVNGKENLSMTVLRDGNVLEIKKVDTQNVSAIGTTRVVLCSGMVFQEVNLSTRFAIGVDADHGVYLSSVLPGSPGREAFAHKKGGVIIKKVNGSSIKDLDDFLDIVSCLDSGDMMRFKVLHIRNGEISSFSARVDKTYWPTREIVRSPETGIWSLHEIFNADSVTQRLVKSSNQKDNDTSSEVGAWQVFQSYVGTFAS